LVASILGFFLAVYLSFIQVGGFLYAN